jgi:nucleolin
VIGNQGMSAEDARKLFVGGLNDAASEDALRAIFSDAGFSVAHLALPRDRETGRVRGFAFVTLATEDEAQAARTRLQGALCAGRSISLREFSQGPKAGGPVRPPRGEEPTVFLGKLPFDATPDEVAQLFADKGCGPVVRVTLPAGPDGRPRGFGFATLDSAETAARAVEKVNGASLRGRSIVVSPAQPRGPRPGGPGGPAGRGPGDAPHEARYEVRGPRAVPREPEPEYFPSEAPAPALDEEGRRRKAEAKRKERGANEKKKADSQYKAGKRQRGGGSSWQQWDKDDD